MVDPAWITLTTTLVSAGQDLLETTAKLVRIDWHSVNSKMSHSSFNNRYSVKAQGRQPGLSYCVTLPFSTTSKPELKRRMMRQKQKRLYSGDRVDVISSPSHHNLSWWPHKLDDIEYL